MDYLEVVVKSEWPTIAGTLLFMLRKQIPKLAENIKEATFAGSSLKFGEKLNELASSVPLPSTEAPKDAIPPVQSESASPLEAEQGTEPKAEQLPLHLAPPVAPTAEQVALLPPPYIVIQAWSDIERAFFQFAGISPLQAVSKFHLAPSPEQIASDVGLPTDTIRFLGELRGLRNQVAHGRADGITLTDALRYRDFANQLIDYLGRFSPVRPKRGRAINAAPKNLTISINIADPKSPVAWVSVLRFEPHKVDEPGDDHMLSPACRTYAEFEAAVSALKDDLDSVLLSARSQLKE